MIKYRRASDTIYIQWTSPDDATTCKYRIEWGTYDDTGAQVPNAPKQSAQYRLTHTSAFNGLSAHTRYWFKGEYYESAGKTLFDSFEFDITTTGNANVSFSGDIYENNITVDVQSDVPMDFSALLDDHRVAIREKNKVTSRTIAIDRLEALTEYKMLVIMRGDDSLFEATYVFTTRQRVDQAIQSDALFSHVLETLKVLDPNQNKAVGIFVNTFKSDLRAATLSDYEPSADQLTNSQMRYIVDLFVTYAIEAGGMLEGFTQELFNWLKYRNIAGELLTSSQKIALFALLKQVADNARLAYESNRISKSIDTLNSVGLVPNPSPFRNVYNLINDVDLPAPSGIDFSGYTEPKIASVPTDYDYRSFAENLVREFTQKDIHIAPVSGVPEPPLVPPGAGVQPGRPPGV